MGDIIIIAVVAVGLFFAARSMRKRVKSGCCGGSVPKAPRKTLDGEKIGEKIITIEGMHCENCKNSVERQINRIDGAAAKVDLKKNIAVVSLSRAVEDAELARAVEQAGFQVVKIEGDVGSCSSI